MKPGGCVVCSAVPLPGRLLCAECRGHAQELEAIRLGLGKVAPRLAASYEALDRTPLKLASLGAARA